MRLPRLAAAWICLAGVLVASQPASAQSDVLTLGDRDTYELAPHARVVEARRGETIDDFAALEASGRFRTPAADPVARFYEGGELWILIDVARTASGVREWVLWDRGAAQFLDVRISAHGETVIHRSGFFVPPQDRPLQAFGYAFPLDLREGEHAEIVMRGYLPPRDTHELVVVSASRFRYLSIRASALVYGVMGAMLALALYNLLVFAVVRDGAYGYYAVYALCSVLLWATTHSLVTLFTRNGRVDMTLQGFAVLLAVLTSLRFTQVFLELPRTAPRLNRWYWVMYAALAIVTALLFALPQPQFRVVAGICGVPIMSTLLLTPGYLLVRGERRARLMVVGWAPLAVIALLIVLRGLGVVDAGWITKDVFIAVHGFEVLSMALAVGDRIREIDIARALAQKEALSQVTLRLEEREELVRAISATRSAEQQAERERVRASTDELTGLRNRRAFDSEPPRLATEWSREEGADAIVTVIDIDGLKTVNDRQGHAAGDRVLAQFGKYLRAALRETDRTYRIGGDEFAVFARANDAVARAAIERRIGGAIAQLRAEFAGVDASLGSAALGEGDGSVLGAFRLADERMYVQKRDHKESRGRDEDLA